MHILLAIVCLIAVLIIPAAANSAHRRRTGVDMSVTREAYLSPEFTVQAEALVRGIYTIAERSRGR